jgi:Tol biopolymer transport system component
VYAWKRDDAPGLYIKPVAGGLPRRIAFDEAANFATASCSKWSPKGDLIAFLVNEEQDFRGLYVGAPSGGTPRYLTSIGGIGLCWTPDGRSLAFNDRNSSGEPFSIFMISLDSGRRERLTTPPAGVFGDTQCAFSPDGRRLAVSRFLSRGQCDLFVSAIRVCGRTRRALGLVDPVRQDRQRRDAGRPVDTVARFRPRIAPPAPCDPPRPTRSERSAMILR